MTNQTILDPPKQLGPNGTRSWPKARSRVWRDREAPNQAAVARAWRMPIPWFHGKKLGKIHGFLHIWPQKSSKHRGLTSDISWWFMDLWHTWKRTSYFTMTYGFMFSCSGQKHPSGVSPCLDTPSRVQQGPGQGRRDLLFGSGSKFEWEIKHL